MKIAIINDIHSNIEALKSAILNIRCMDIDEIIILGDILTYGVKINETIEALHCLSKDYKCYFIKGNHEQIYFDIQAGRDFEYKPFPAFVMESVKYTSKIIECVLEREFCWQDSHIIDGIYFAHANIFSYANWSYLNNEIDFDDNHAELINKGLRAGIFGHTHRSKYKIFSDAGLVTKLKTINESGSIYLNENESLVLTNGSLGQPRGCYSPLLIADTTSYKFKSIEVDYDISLHHRSIVESTLSLGTKEKLLSYYLT